MSSSSNSRRPGRQQGPPPPAPPQSFGPGQDFSHIHGQPFYPNPYQMPHPYSMSPQPSHGHQSYQYPIPPLPGPQTIPHPQQPPPPPQQQQQQPPQQPPPQPHTQHPHLHDASQSQVLSPPSKPTSQAQRKRKAPGASSTGDQSTLSPTDQAVTSSGLPPNDAAGQADALGTAPKKSRTNTPWSPAEESLLKEKRDLGQTWGEIAKFFPQRTEGSVKKHWYKDMHYADFGEDDDDARQSQALFNAIKEYDANKWKYIGQKLGKPAKACEQYAKEHFQGKM